MKNDFFVLNMRSLTHLSSGKKGSTLVIIGLYLLGKNKRKRALVRAGLIAVVSPLLKHDIMYMSFENRWIGFYLFSNLLNT